MEVVSASMAPAPHFLMLPFSEQGHLSPMLSLASQLVALGCRATFVKADHPSSTADQKQEAADHQEQNGDGGGLYFVTQGGHEAESAERSRPSTEREKVDTFGQILEDIEARQRRLVERLISEARASACPISCIICDFFLWQWVSRLALSHGLPLAILVCCSATFFHVHLLQQKGKDSEIEEVLVSGYGLPESGFLQETKETINFFNHLFEGVDSAGHTCLVNSFQVLEAPLLPFLDASPLKLRFFGPCLPAWRKADEGYHNAMAQQAGSAFSEDHRCFDWLDKQEKGSVMYVSFGSQATMRTEEQAEELAMGIEKSGRKFLWVVRPDAPVASRPPEAFEERIRRDGNKRGMFAEWVPQKRVLQHPALGAFLTHSGWNSTLESLTFGVPMLCLPFYGDQPLNADIVQEYWKTGLRLVPDKSTGRVGREEVERCVRALLPASEALSSCLGHLQQAAQEAIADAHHTLTSFISGI